MSTNAKIAATVTAALLLIVAGIVTVAALNSAPQLPVAEDGTPIQPTVIRDNTHRLDTAADGNVTLVEFLDFECEACGYYYPYTEQLREEYAGRVTFAFRYFPLPGHGNSMNAAVAVESAAQQGQLEPMFSRMFETQTVWAEKGAESQAHVFRAYAEELGLDMAQYDADVADPATQSRVELDFNEGIALGVDGTPSFFLNGESIGVPKPDELRALLEAALRE